MATKGPKTPKPQLLKPTIKLLLKNEIKKKEFKLAKTERLLSITFHIYSQVIIRSTKQLKTSKVTIN